MDFRERENYEKGPFTQPHDFILLYKVGQSNCQWFLDMKCQPVCLLNCPEALFNFDIVLLL